MIKRLKRCNKNPPAILTFLQCSQTDNNLQPVINAGIPEITPDQVLTFITGIVTQFYDFAAELSPQVTLFIFIIGGIVGIFLNEAKKAVLWAIIGMLLILWGPQVISLLSNFTIR
ncbi:MAG: hypothetical protein K9L17_04655 [Clostridiales bacterium]|nr:hypothetical protein [Clostridiales bacterium]MCF8021965.1 hypothetical protein [Clostridiales bacterium]